MKRQRRTPSQAAAVPGWKQKWLAGMRIWGLVVCAVGTACLVFFSFPRYSHAGLAWIALVPFLWGVCQIRGFWHSFFYGWVTALLFHAGLFYWIYYTCRYGGGLSVGLSAAAWLGLCALLSLQFACFAGSCYFLKKAKAKKYYNLMLLVNGSLHDV